MVACCPSRQDHGPGQLDFNLPFSLLHATYTSEWLHEYVGSNVIDLSGRTVKGQGRMDSSQSHSNMNRTEARHEARSAANFNHALRKGEIEKKKNQTLGIPALDTLHSLNMDLGMYIHKARPYCRNTRRERQQAGRSRLVRGPDSGIVRLV